MRRMERVLSSRAAEYDGKPVVCPECPEILPSLDELGIHIERHSPVGLPEYSRRGIPLTAPCPKGCGRHFPTRKAGHVLVGHVRLCAGQPPLPIEMAAWSVGGARC